MVGEEEAWAEIQSHCEAWYEFLAGWLFYTEPTVKSFELGQFAKHSIAKMRMKHHMKHLDRVLLAAMEFDMFEVGHLRIYSYCNTTKTFVDFFNLPFCNCVKCYVFHSHLYLIVGQVCR